MGGSFPVEERHLGVHLVDDVFLFPPWEIFKAYGQQDFRRREIEVHPGVICLEIDIGEQAGGIQFFSSGADVLLGYGSSEMDAGNLLQLFAAGILVSRKRDRLRLILLCAGGADRKMEEEDGEDPRSHTLENYYKRDMGGGCCPQRGASLFLNA